jgi:uncharacterized membrane protein HdeD (DUF308 family)
LETDYGSVLAELRAHAGWIVAFGIALIILGVLALGSVLAATIATAFLCRRHDAFSSRR